MRNFVINLLKNNLPETYCYHNPGHTIYVEEKVLEIGRQEECTEAELKLLSTAALWHDTGYIKTYKNHEAESCLLARQYLPDYGYSPTDIELVCEMIMVTKIPQSPKNKLEEILADADLEYLGTSDFEAKAFNLFKELQLINLSLTEAEWNQMQISFLQNHHYFTLFCKQNRDPLKMKNLYQLMHTNI